MEQRSFKETLIGCLHHLYPDALEEDIQSFAESADRMNMRVNLSINEYVLSFKNGWTQLSEEEWVSSLNETTGIHRYGCRSHMNHR